MPKEILTEWTQLVYNSAPTISAHSRAMRPVHGDGQFFAECCRVFVLASLSLLASKISANFISTVISRLLRISAKSFFDLGKCQNRCGFFECCLFTRMQTSRSRRREKKVSLGDSVFDVFLRMLQIARTDLRCIVPFV